MVDRETVLARIARIHEMLQVLRGLPPVDAATFAADPDLHLKAERCLEVLAQAVLDIGSHILAERGLPKPDRYADIFRILGEHGVLETGLASRLSKLTGLRNILVHGYLAVDRLRLHAFIASELGDIDRFVLAVFELVEET